MLACRGGNAAGQRGGFMKPFMRVIAAAGIFVGMHAPSHGDTFPVRPVKLINPAAVGSATDVVGRMVGDQLAKAWAQPVITENRPGAGGVLAAQAAAQAAPDGHTLFFAAASAL